MLNLLIYYLGGSFDVTNHLLVLAVSGYDGGYETGSNFTQSLWNNFEGAFNDITTEDDRLVERLIYTVARLGAISISILSTMKLPDQLSGQDPKAGSKQQVLSRYALKILICLLVYDLEDTIKGTSDFFNNPL